MSKLAPPPEPPPWRLFVDTGGTFTDCLAIAPDGSSRRAKVLSSSALRGRVASVDNEPFGEPFGERGLLVADPWALPEGFFIGCSLRPLGAAGPGVEIVGWSPAPAPGEPGRLELSGAPEPPLVAGDGFEIRSPEEVPVFAARLVTGTPCGRPLPPLELRLATTRGTNALLERRGSRTVLFITRGFGDLLAIGTQQRPDLFALDVRRPAPLEERVVEVDERLAADGSVLVELDLETLRPRVAGLVAEGIESAAVALIHSFRNPEHEERLAALLEDEGLAWVSPSHRLAPRIGLLARTQTAVVDAYLAPVVGRYVERVGSALGPGSRLQVMTSAGGLVAAEGYRAKDSLLSGPAGGVVGAAAAGRRSGFERVLAFDMGGTSTDVSRYDGELEYRFEHEVGGARLLAPALAIETVAAGGGSICAFRHGRVQVGPESAGADPGPACYGAGGPLTVTDVNLLLGRLDAERFGIPIDKAAAARRLAELSERLTEATGEQPTDEVLLQGLLDIADERMAEAIRAISVRRGYDPREYALVAFGGAGAQHACAVAELLGADTVVVPEDAALLSARGLRSAVVERFAERQVLEPLEAVAERLESWLDELAARAVEEVRAQGVSEVRVRRRLAFLRFAGQESPLEVAVEPGVSLHRAFEEAYRETYGYRPEDRVVELESLRVVASCLPEAPLPPLAVEPHEAPATGRRRVWSGGTWRSVATFERERLAPGARFAGPALVFERHSSAMLAPGWRGHVDTAGALVFLRGDADAP